MMDRRTIPEMIRAGDGPWTSASLLRNGVAASGAVMFANDRLAAADRIEALEAENARLKLALGQIQRRESPDAGKPWRFENIVNLDDHRPHVAAYVACLDCGKDWIAAAPADTLHFECPDCAKLSGVVVDPSSAEFLNTFMRPAKSKAARAKRTMVVLNAQRMINEGAFQ